MSERCKVCGAGSEDHCQRASQFSCVKVAAPATITPPATVAALVEALEEAAEALELEGVKATQARAALALFRGEAGR